MQRFLLSLLLFFCLASPVFAQEELLINSVTPTPPQTVEYTLPYPGILPNNPLYPLKAARDRIVSFFISDPQKRAEFDLLQADKRLQAGLFLLHQEKPEVMLAISTISKGQNYFEEALIATEKAREENEEAVLGDLTDRLVRSARKQHELLTNEEKNAENSRKDDFATLVKRSNGFITNATKLRKTE